MQCPWSTEAWGLAQLQEMGFGADECALALVDNRWDVPAAALALQLAASPDQAARANQAPGPSPARGEDTEAAGRVPAPVADSRIPGIGANASGPASQEHAVAPTTAHSGQRPPSLAMCVHGCPLPAYTRRGACCSRCRTASGPHVRRCEQMLLAMRLGREAGSLPDEE